MNMQNCFNVATLVLAKNEVALSNDKAEILNFSLDAENLASQTRAGSPLHTALSAVSSSCVRRLKILARNPELTY